MYLNPTVGYMQIKIMLQSVTLKDLSAWQFHAKTKYKIPDYNSERMNNSV